MNVSIINGLGCWACTIINCSPTINGWCVGSCLSWEESGGTTTFSGVSNVIASWDTTDHDTSLATWWGLIRIDIVCLAGHEFLIDLAGSLAPLEATVFQDGILDSWGFAWGLELAALGFSLDPLATFAVELPNIGPSRWDVVTITLAGQGALVDSGVGVLRASVSSVWLVGLFALLVPLT